MTTEEILKAVSDAEPDLMSKTANIIAMTERLYPEFVEGIMEDFETVCSMVKEKTADKATGFQSFAMGVGASAATGLLAAIATDLYDSAKRGLTKGRNWERIMKANPSLKREVDGRSLSMAFDTLHRYAPEFTSDPLLGGALLKNVAELPNMSHKMIIELIGASKNINDGKGRHFSEISKLGPTLVPDAGRTELQYRRDDKDRKLRLSGKTVQRPGE